MIWLFIAALSGLVILCGLSLLALEVRFSRLVDHLRDRGSIGKGFEP